MIYANSTNKKDRNKKTKALNCLVNYNLKLMRESLLLSLIIERHNHGNHFIYQQQPDTNTKITI